MEISPTANDADDFETSVTDLFREPIDFYQQEKQPTFAEHKLLDGKTLQTRLVGHNPLWGHHLWNAGRVTAHYLEENSETLLKGRRVLELGAGAGLPSLVAALKGAQNVVITDYPDPDLIENLRWNVQQCPLPNHSAVSVEGYIWGQSTEHLLAHLKPGNGPAKSDDAKFDVLILSDLIFNHTQHTNLLSTVCQTLSQSADAVALIFFTPHRPWLYEKDLEFFKLAEEGGFHVDKILEKKMNPMFEADPGDVELRRTVYGYVLKWKSV